MNSKATLIGSSAIMMWSLLALFTSTTHGIPPFQLLFLTFSIAAGFGLLFIIIKNKNILKTFRLPIKVWVIGVGGLFGYHFFYFTALANAPVEDASLIAYLWPLLIVLLSSLTLGEKLHWFHITGAFSALFGALILLGGTGDFSFSAQYGFGYAMALISALIWSTYSVLNRTISHVPTEAVAGFCIMTAILSALSHFMIEQWVVPSPWQWAAIVGLGIGPVGAAFYAWDFGTKHGNIRLLGVLSYAAPLLSTIILTVSGHAEFTWNLMLACLLIAGGALLASLDILKKRRL